MSTGSSIVDVAPFAGAIASLPRTAKEVAKARATGEPGGVQRACDDLLRHVQRLFNAEVSAIFLIDGSEAVLQAHVGYHRQDGSPISLGELQAGLRYELTQPAVPGCVFSGITGLVASTGEEFGASSWEEIRKHPSHLGKPDTLAIWSQERPFRGVLAVPLRRGLTTIGVLKVENKRDAQGRPAAFTDADQALLRAVAGCFGQELERAGDSGRGGAEASPSHASLAALAATHDRSHMQTVIDNFPGQIDAALAQTLPQIHVPRDGYRKVVIVGMGGSALPADVVSAAFQDVLTVDIEVVRHYVLPTTIDERCLVIVSSFSGSTEETLEALDALPRQARNVAVVTAGGALQAVATERGYPLVRIPVEREPAGFQPRSATGYFLTYFGRILAAAGLMPDPTSALAQAAAFVRSLHLKEDAERLARWLGSRIPVVYTDEQYMLSVARIAKIKFNENSKRPAFFNALPEANHNEMIGFVKDLGHFAVVYIHNQGSHPRVLRRFDVMEKVFREDGLRHVDFYRWTMPGTSRLENVLSTLAFIEQCSYYLALLDGFDPTPVDLVQKFKQEMVS